MKISLVIPVYNGEKYIEKCLKSILGQTYKNIEVIIINDGSEDNSEIICKQMQEKDNRIIIFSQKNSGTSIARKKGILNASGDYIMFSDQDDYYNNHKAFEEIVKKILEYPEGKVSVLQYSNYKKFRFFKVKNTCKKCEITKEEFQEKQVRDLLTSNTNETIITPTVWNKVYKSSIIKESVKKIDKQLKMTEDLYLNLMVFTSDDIDMIISLDKAYYTWRTGIGFSSNLNYMTILHDYNILKMKQNEVIDQLELNKEFLFACQVESIYLLIVFIKEELNKNIQREELENIIKEFYQEDFIKTAISYFKNISEEDVWDEIRVMLTEDSSLIYSYFQRQYLKYSKMKKMKQKIKSILRKFM